MDDGTRGDVGLSVVIRHGLPTLQGLWCPALITDRPTTRWCLQAVSVGGSVEADELLDPYLLSPGSAYDDDDFALSVPSTPVAQVP